MEENKLRIAGVAKESVVDGPGIRYVIFIQGCPHHCKECHNPETHDISAGYVIDSDNIKREIQDDPLLQGITISGGEPFLQADAVANLLDKINIRNLNVIVYTGYLYEFLVQNSSESNNYIKLLEKTDILIDGKFEKDLKDYNLIFKGSSNQRVIDCKVSLKAGKTIIFDF